MPEIKNNFIQGKMNKDLDDRLLPNGQYRDGFNIRISKSENSDVGTVQNVKGNDYASGSATLSLPREYHPNNHTGAGEPLLDTVGYYADSLEGYIFWFVTSFTGSTSDDILNTTYTKTINVAANDVTHDDDSSPNTTIEIANASNYTIERGMKVTGTGVVADTFVQSVSISNNVATVNLNKIQSGQTVLDGVALTLTHTCRIYYMNTKLNIPPTVLIDNDKLNFSKGHHIHHVNLINNLLFWTDNYNQPRRINIDLAINGNTYIDNDFFEDKISVAQYMPYSAPKVKMEAANGTIISGDLGTNILGSTNRNDLTNGTHEVELTDSGVSTSGDGENAVFNVTVNGGTITQINFTVPGNGFKSGDTITMTPTVPWIPTGFSSTNIVITLTGNELIENSKHIQDKFVKFGYRFQYENNEYSVISPFTQTCFIPGKGKTMNRGSYLSGEAGLLSATDRNNAYKNTTVDSMQNVINRVHLFIDLPTNISKYSIGAADAGPSTVAPNSHLIGLSHTIHGVNQDDASNNPIANGDKVLTARGDEYTVNSISVAQTGDSTLTTTTRILPSIVPKERLYFFDSIATYTNPLNIKKIEIVYVESNSLAVKVVETISLNNTTTYSHRVEPITNNKGRLVYGYSYIYNASKPIKTLPSNEITRVMDSVPIKAHTQEMSGNRIIYGNFKQNRPLSQAISSNAFSVNNGNQEKINNSYLLSSVKSVREYSVGLVLSDRYGRQSTVFLPDVATTFVKPQDTTTSTQTGGLPGVTPGVGGANWSYDDIWTHSVLKLDFSSTIQDLYDAETNPLGWYTYKVVVKQPDQEYYNVYAPNLIDNIPAANKKSWLVLYGDNINKVPRDITDVSTETGLAGSKVQLLPRIQYTTNYFQNPDNDFISVISIGKASEHNATVQNFTGASGDQLLPDFYKSITDPLLAELPDGLGVDYSGGSAAFGNLVTLETKPVHSALDIYYETSTAGLISDLNESILAATGALPSQITISSNTFLESANSGTIIGAFTANDSSGNQLSGESYALVEVFDGGGNNRTSEFVVTGNNLKTATTFIHKNKPTDDFTVTIQVTDNAGNTFNENISIELLNVAPTIFSGTGSMNLGASTPSGTQIRTIVAVNGSATSLSNNIGLTYAITNGNSAGKFSIHSFTGVISTAGTVATGESYTLQITVSDSGGLQAAGNLNISVVTVTRTSFYRSTAGKSTASLACNEPAAVQVYHDGSGTLPVNGDKVYTTATGTTVFDSQTLYHSMAQDPAGASDQKSRFRTNSSGVVSDVDAC